jgi:hypothetical protein
MAFLDNSGDIILDAVLTDLGRELLAKGDGSMKVHSFCLADDEIDYGTYNTAHTGGTEYYDLETLQTPVLEAFTNNMSSMKSKLVTYTSNNLLYLPSLRLNDGKDPDTNNFKGIEAVHHQSSDVETDMFLVAVDRVTEVMGMVKDAQGFLRGANPTAKVRRAANSFIRVEQGVDTSEIGPTNSLKALFPELYETQYDIEIDSRLGSLIGVDGQAMRPAYIDDDLIAVYRVSENANPYMVYNIGSETQNSSESDAPKIRGPRGTRVDFKLASSVELQTSNFLFTKIGSSYSAFQPSNTYYHSANPITQNNAHTRAAAGELIYIDSSIRVSGVTTGVSTEINVRWLKCTGCVEKKTST